MKYLFSVDKNPSLIPPGPYCYRWVEAPSPDNNFTGVTEPCPFYGEAVLNGVNVPWCHFLKQGGLDNRDYGDEWAKLVQHFGSEDALRKGLPLNLLWDGVKECGEGLDEEVVDQPPV